MTSIDFLDTYRLIWSHLSHEATRLAKYTIIMQLSLSFFVGSQTQCGLGFSFTLSRYYFEGLRAELRDERKQRSTASL